MNIQKIMSNHIRFTLKVTIRGNLEITGEAHGIPSEWQKQCDELLTLPMPGKTESLNASVAGSIAAYLAWK